MAMRGRADDGGHGGGGAGVFDTRDRMWPAIVLPALLARWLTLPGARGSVPAPRSLLLVMRDFRLVGALPVLVALFVALAPPQVTERFYSMFDLRIRPIGIAAMLHEGVRMIGADPLTGMGPNMVSGCMFATGTPMRSSV